MIGEKNLRILLNKDKDISGENPLATGTPPLLWVELHDSFLSQYQNAFPVLEKHGWKVSWATIPSVVGNSSNLTLDQVKEVALAGHEICMHGLTHEYPGVIGSGIALAADAGAGSTVLSMISVGGFGSPSADVPLKARIKDNANPTGELIDIINVNFTLKQLTLSAGLTRSYTMAQSAVVTLNDPTCLNYIYERAHLWFLNNLHIKVRNFVGTGSVNEHLAKEAYFFNKYFRHVSFEMPNYPVLDLSSIYALGITSYIPFIARSSNRSADLTRIKRYLAANARQGRALGMFFHEIKNTPNYANVEVTPAEFEEILKFAENSGHRIVTLETVISYAERNSSKYPKCMLWADSIAPSTTTSINDSNFLEVKGGVALTVECTYNASATDGLRIHVRSSANGSDYDTADLYQFDNDFAAGQTKRKTVEINPKVSFIKVLAENLDSAQTVTNMKVTATLEG